MTGSQLRHWRTTHDLTLRQLAEQLGSVVHYSTITGWELAENGTKEIPEWATEKILATTQIPLPLDELHQLIEAARLDNLPAQELIAQAIQEWLQRRNQPEIQATPITDAGRPLTLYSADVPAPAKVAEPSAAEALAKAATAPTAADHLVKGAQMFDAAHPLPPPIAPAVPRSVPAPPPASFPRPKP